MFDSREMRRTEANQVQQMSDLDWLRRVVRVRSLEELRHCGVRALTAPQLPLGASLVNLENGRVVVFRDEREIPAFGHYADVDSLIRLSRSNGISLQEEGGSLRRFSSAPPLACSVCGSLIAADSPYTLYQAGDVISGKDDSGNVLTIGRLTVLCGEHSR
jgi:hypothetical protein